MSKVLITRSKLDDLAVAVSAKSGATLPLTIAQMQTAVEGIQPGGTLVTKSITQNGTYDAEDDNADGYSSVTVNVSGGGSTYSLTNIVPQQTVATTTSNLYGYVGLIPSYTAYVQSGEWYLVTYDSTEYVCTGYYGANSEIMAGDYQLLTTDVPWVETPFLVEHNLTNGYFFLGTRVSGNHTLKVDKINFLDDGVTLINKTITANGTYNASSDNADGFEAVTVNVPSSAPNLQAKTNISPTTSSQTITADSGYDGLSSVQINAMPSGTAGTPTATKGTVSNHSITVTPSVTNTTGYITGSTKTGTAVTVSASELVSGSQTITSNQTVDVTNLASIVVNVAGGGGLTLLKTTSLGTLQTSSTSASDTGKTMTVTGYNDYDVLIVDVSVDSPVNGRHTSTVSFVILTGTSSVGTKNTYTVAGNKWNSKLSSSGTGSTRQSTSAYGIYVNSASVSSSTMTLAFYYRYNSNSTGTLNGTYTARVYGLKLYDLIGG